MSGPPMTLKLKEEISKIYENGISNQQIKDKFNTKMSGPPMTLKSKEEIEELNKIYERESLDFFFDENGVFDQQLKDAFDKFYECIEKEKTDIFLGDYELR